MDAESSQLCECLNLLVADYENRRRSLTEYFSAKLAKLNQDGFTPQKLAEFELERKKREALFRAENDPYPAINLAIGRLCARYLRSDSVTRQEIRAFVAQRETLRALVWQYANGVTAQIVRADDTVQLTLGLAAVSIENCGSDYRDTLTTLADLYVCAEQVGLDPKPIFEAAAEMSTDTPTSGGCDSLAEMLRDFERCAVVSERRRMGRPYHLENR